MPRISPAIFSRVNRSMPSATESTRTSSGTTVSMIEPSIGEVCARPNMRNDLRMTPMSRAAAKNLRMSAGSTFSARSHSSGTSEMSAVTTSEADTSASGCT